MISRTGYALWIALALACGSTLAQEVRWAPDIATARRAALEYKVPLLIHFYGDNCLPCKLLEQNVLTRAEVVETLNKYFICVRVNGSQDRQVAAEYGVHSWPTDVFVGPDGTPLDQGTCKQSPGEYLSVLHNMAVLNRDRNVLLASQQKESAKQVTSQVANYAQAAQQAVGTAAQTGGAAASQMSASGLAQANNIAAQANNFAGQANNFAAQAQNIPPQLNAMGGPLPGAGMVQAGNPNGPNFYAQGSGTGLQQLPGSLAPNSGVTSGPMLNQNQPHAIATAVGAAGSQIAAAATSHVLGGNQGQLPPAQVNAQLPPTVHPANVNPMHTMVAGAPSIPAPQATPAANNNAWNGQPRVSSGNSQVFSNPHFASAPPLPGSAVAPAANTQPSAQPTTPPMPTMHMTQTASMPNASPQMTPAANNATTPQGPALSSKVPANTVSFQPRAALSVEANRAAATTQPSMAVDSQLNGVQGAATGPSAALEGYCPVALKTQGTWSKGQPQFAVKHRGRVYHLGSQAAMQAFLQSPDSSSPILSGYDAMIFLNEGKLVEGNIQYGLHEQVSGSILLFSSAESKQAYEQDYDRNTQALKIVLRNAGIEL